MNSQTLYDNQIDFSRPVDADIYNIARRAYVDHRTEYHLQNPIKCDLDVLSYENGQLIDFINAYQANPLDAARAFWRSIEAEAEKLAEDDATDAAFETIMSFIGEH